MKKMTLNKHILFYFLIFSVFILLLLWVFQVLFLDKFYRFQRTNEIDYIAQELKKVNNGDELYKLIDKLSFEREACIEIRSQENLVYNSIYFGKGCLRNGRSKTEYINYFLDSNLEEGSFNIKNEYTGSDTIFHGVKLSDSMYAFINTSLDPIDSTSRILSKQLIIVSILVFLFAFITSFFISKKLSYPISVLNSKTRNIAKGKFNEEINIDCNILEINELVSTINYTRRELAKTDELRRDLMANVSHDLKTPLTMIKAYAEMSRDLHSKDKEKRENDCNIIISEVDRLSLLVNDILDLSKMQSNTIKPVYEEFDIIMLCNEIIKRYSVFQDTEDFKINFSHNVESLIINADKKMIEQVIYNLVNNAINYTGDDKAIFIDINKTDNLIRFSVKDTGKGINEEDIPYIWDKYYKNEKKHKRNIIGTGLGLSIVKNALDEHHYNYGVNTSKGKGTTFYFEIDEKKV